MDSVPRAALPRATGGVAVADPAESAAAARVETGPPPNPWPLRIGLAALGFVAIAAMLFVVYLVNRPVQHTAVVVHWPLAERKGALLDVSGSLVEIGKREPIVVHVDPGPHRVRIQRHGFEPVTFEFSLSKGEQKELKPEWRSTKER